MRDIGMRESIFVQYTPGVLCISHLDFALFNDQLFFSPGIFIIRLFIQFSLLTRIMYGKHNVAEIGKAQVSGKS